MLDKRNMKLKIWEGVKVEIKTSELCSQRSIKASKTVGRRFAYGQRKERVSEGRTRKVVLLV